jgi:hypothetical protein
MQKKKIIFIICSGFILICLASLLLFFLSKKGMLIPSTPTTNNLAVDHFGFLTSTKPISDGLLEISIQNKEISCYSLSGDRVIYLEYSIRNISDEPVLVSSDMVLATNMTSIKGNLLVAYFDQDLQFLLRPTDIIDAGFEKNPENITYFKLKPNGLITGEQKLIFPNEFAIGNNAENDFTAPKAGKYYIKLVYRGYVNNEGGWDGTIASNLQEICFK